MFMSSMIIKAYHRLLADIRIISGVPLGVPDNITDEWVLIEGPKLDKQLLNVIERIGPNLFRKTVLDNTALSESTDEFLFDFENQDGTFDRCELGPVPKWLTPLFFELFNKSWTPRMFGYIRQLLLFCYKAEHEPTKQQIDEAQKSFIDCDDGCEIWNTAFKSRTPDPLFRVTRNIIGRIIGQIDWTKIVPKHGPGSVFPGSLPCDKSKFVTIYEGIQELYPFDSYFCGLPSFWADHIWHEKNGQLREESQITAKLVAVPKDSRGPRLICVHPKESIWIQQGQRMLIEDAISTNVLTRGKINFSDQNVNGSLALESSRSRENVTLDLKEASDRISKDLVDYLFGWSAKYLNCSRASHVRLLDGRVVLLRKFAPMGNALCFPVQSLVFWALVRAGIQCRYGKVCNDVYVFGDDIIYPANYHEGAQNALVRAGLVPNASKTFRMGFFRESCGVDAYYGTNVTPLRMRSSNVITVSDAVATCDLAKRLRIAGYEGTASCLYVEVSKKFGVLSLNNNIHSQGIFEYVDYDFGKLLRYGDLRFNRSLHRWEARNLLVTATISKLRKDAWWHLQDSLLRLMALYGEDYNMWWYKTSLVLSNDRPASMKRKFRRSLEEWGHAISSDGIAMNLEPALTPGDLTSQEERSIPEKWVVVEIPLPFCGYSERGLEYTVPYRARLKLGWTPIVLR